MNHGTAVKRIAVVGAGPKAAALAAKAWCLNQLSGPPKNLISVAVFDRNGAGAAWTGRHGYTDGDQALCTPAERDIGFPYSDDLYPGVSELMHQKFSWGAFLISKGEGAYSDWLNRGRRPPSHREFARYLGFAFREAKLRLGTHVNAVEKRNDKWLIVDIEGNRFPGFDGIVVSGPGPAKSIFTSEPIKHVYDGQSFWRSLGQIRRRLNLSPNKRVTIVGGGGTTAAVAAWLSRNEPDAVLTLLNSQATLFSRGVNFFENRLFDDDVTWKSLSNEDRRQFVDRLNRGVVWENVTGQLSQAKNIALVPGKAIGIARKGKDLRVAYQNLRGVAEIEADLVVDATGFNSWHFMELLPAVLRRSMERAGRSALEDAMLDDLSFDLPGYPKLHAPFHSQIVGPGFMSLMALGGAADRVLRPYLTP